jgi:hypothetical protein
MTNRELILRWVQRTLLGALVLLVLIYAGDFLLLRYRIATNHGPFGTDTVRTYYAVPQKNHKTEFLFDEPQDETCVHSLFPHLGDEPCWYLSTHKDQRIDI